MSSRNNEIDEDADDVREEIYGDEAPEEEEEGEDLFGDDMMRDYREQPELDQLSESGLDDGEDYEDDISARRRAENEMNRRDGMLDIDALMFDGIDDRSARRDDSSQNMEAEIEEAQDIPIDLLENMRNRSARDHVADEAVGREIERRFRNFLRTFKDKATGEKKYMKLIEQLASENKGSIVVDYIDLACNEGEENIAYFLPEAPFQVLERLDRAFTAIVYSIYPFYAKLYPIMNVRIRDLPVEEDIRMLRQLHLNMLIRTSGVVTQTTGILPQLSIVKYDCLSCGYLVGPFTQYDGQEIRPSICPSCQGRGPFQLNLENTVYRSFQRIVIQESPNKIAAGRLPRSKDVILLGDLCDSCKPGDEIDITGVYTNNYDGSLNNKQGFPVFSTIIHANFIYNKDKVEEDSLTDEELRSIRQLSKDSRINERIFASIAPSIYGHDNVKRAIALALFRGQAKNPGEKHSIRGDINILLCGDPGCAKSQFLRYAGHIAPRAVLTTGQGASAVGLTAYVQRHPVTREWTLEAGAMVLADKGVCLIDEFDKMNDQDRTSIHEAMEQQSISVSKAGIVTSLQARCTVIAAANPIGGRYDPSRTFAENVDLTEPILSRFDVLCVIRDIVDPVEDERLAHFVASNHIRLHPANTEFIETEGESQESQEEMQRDRRTGLELIPQDLLRKYIIYARENIHPKLDERVASRFTKLYSELRKESLATGSVVVTVRMVESMIRLAEAHAKVFLRQHVNDEDVDMAIRIMLDSFISTQKASILRQMERKFSKYRLNNRSSTELLLFVLRQMAREQLLYESTRIMSDSGDTIKNISIPESEFLEKARVLRIDNVQPFYDSEAFSGDHFTYDRKRRVIEQAIF